MHLRFLGQAYSSSHRQVETVTSENTARFRGQNYIPRCPVNTSKSQLGLRKYRGVVYGAES